MPFFSCGDRAWRPWWLEIPEQSPREETAAQKVLWTSGGSQISLCEQKPDQGIPGKKGPHRGTLGEDGSVHCLDRGFYIGQSFQCVHNVCGLLHVRYTTVKLSSKTLHPQPQFLLVCLIVWDATETVPTAFNVIQATLTFHLMTAAAP